MLRLNQLSKLRSTRLQPYSKRILKTKIIAQVNQDYF